MLDTELALSQPLYCKLVLGFLAVKETYRKRSALFAVVFCSHRPSHLTRSSHRLATQRKEKTRRKVRIMDRTAEGGQGTFEPNKDDSKIPWPSWTKYL